MLKEITKRTRNFVPVLVTKAYWGGVEVYLHLFVTLAFD